MESGKGVKSVAVRDRGIFARGFVAAGVKYNLEKGLMESDPPAGL